MMLAQKVLIVISRLADSHQLSDDLTKVSSCDVYVRAASTKYLVPWV